MKACIRFMTPFIDKTLGLVGPPGLDKMNTFSTCTDSLYTGSIQYKYYITPIPAGRGSLRPSLKVIGDNSKSIFFLTITHELHFRLKTVFFYLLPDSFGILPECLILP